MLSKLTALPILFAIWLVNTIFRFIKVESAWNLGECLGTLCYRMMPKRREVVDYNMQVVSASVPSITPSPELTESIFQRNIANLTCSLKTYGMPPKQLSKCVDIQVSEEFRELVINKKGAILCLAHMGNWEILSKIALLITPFPENFGAVYRPLDNKVADDYVAKQRSEYKCQMFSKSTSIGTLSSFIREGGVLGILADQRSGRPRKTNRPFFGKQSARSQLPAVLQLRTNAPLFSVNVTSTSPAHWKITISPIPLPETDKLTKDQVVEAITKSYEKSFSSDLLDVFWLHRYWV
ncbi:lysophospholipid acyltransferase family protein [Rubritalea sp.]|uniref:lysophospholipid acyltransferase family protein n=1 Tax=Rubritalea sp. TaxID=2109375 RepID=UPI003EF3460F